MKKQPKKVSRILSAVIVVVIAAGALPARADSVTISGVPYGNCKIVAVSDCSITFRLTTGKSVTKDVSELSKISVENFPLLDKAEELLKADKNPQAATAYDEALRWLAQDDEAGILAKKPWLKRLIDYRRLIVLNKSGQIGPAVEIWLRIMDANNGSAKAAGFRPDPPSKKNPTGNRAIELLSARANHAVQSYAEAANQLRVKLLDVQGRTDEAMELCRKLPAGRIETDLILAALLVKTNQAQEALKILKPLIARCTTNDLPDAMLLLGKSQYALSGQAKGKDRQEFLYKAGLNLMRVVAFFADRRQQASEALYYAAKVNQSFSKPDLPAAKAAYEKIISDYKNTPTAQKAKHALAEMKTGN